MTSTGTEMTDWASLEELRREWSVKGADLTAGLEAWRTGMAIYDATDDYGSMIRAGGLMCLALRHHLYGEGVLAGADLPETTRRVLFSSCCPPPDRQAFPQAVAAQIRLGLAVVKKHGWQPVAWGGDGLLAEIIEGSHMVLAMAVAPDPARMLHGDVAGFFASPAFAIDDDTVPVALSATSERTDRELDEMLEHGRQVLRDAELGDPASQARARGIAAAMSGNDEEGLRQFEEAARLGDVDSMYDSGCLLVQSGQGSQARFWFETAAAQGHRGAMYNLGAAAIGEERVADAEQWWTRAADAGDADACAALTELAAQREDGDAELRWSKLGAEREQPFCELRHGQLLMRQRPTDRQWFEQQALPLLTRAADQGQEGALFLIGIGYGSVDDMSTARLWLRRAEAAGDADATRVLRENGLA
jgi:hypothetical protein